MIIRSIGSRFTILFCLTLLLLIANAVISYKSTNTLITNNGWVFHTQEVMTKIDDTLLFISDAETGQRGYLLTGDPSFLDIYNNALGNIHTQIKQIKDLTVDNWMQQERIPPLVQKINVRLDTLKTGIEIRDKEGLEALLRSRTLYKGKAQMDDIRQHLLLMKDTESKLLIIREEASRVSARNTVLTFTLSSVLVLVLLGLVYYLLTRDITERERAALALREANESLEIRVEERTAALADTNNVLESEIIERKRTEEKLRLSTTELERSNRELQDFAFVASHDLQEPLRKIQAFGDRLKTKHGPAFNDEGRDYLERMQNAAKRMHTLINDLLTFSRVTTKAKPFTQVDLSEIAEEVLSDLEVRVQQTNGRVEVEDLPTIEADALQMRQLLQNLIGNALKFHRPGVAPIVKIKSKLLNGDELLSEDFLDTELCQIAIEDNGIGFEEKYLDRIFTPFQRLHSRNEYEGTGMGLAVCRKIAERHGGNITAKSSPGEGTTFLVTLPIKQKPIEELI